MNKKEFEEIYRRFHYSLMWETRKYNLPDGLGEELVNDSFLIFKRYYDPERSKETTFLHFILRNKIRTLFIRNKITYKEHFNFEDCVDDNFGLYDFDKEEKLIHIEEIVKTLPSIYKECIYLYFYLGIPQKEISELLEINYSTLKSRIHQAKKLIRKKIKKSGRY